MRDYVIVSARFPQKTQKPEMNFLRVIVIFSAKRSTKFNPSSQWREEPMRFRVVEISTAKKAFRKGWRKKTQNKRGKHNLKKYFHKIRGESGGVRELDKIILRVNLPLITFAGKVTN